MKTLKFLSALFAIISGTQLSAQELKNKMPFSIGESVTFYSNELLQDRTLNVYLPQGYFADSAKKYPVIYLLDGSADEDFIHVAGLVQFGSFPWIGMIPETIVVGISNADRRRDFTFPTSVKKDLEDFPTTGKSANFISFIENELQPFVEKNYKTNSTRTIVGQSLGGLLATEILLKNPDLFDNYIIVSPSLWWNNQSLLELETPSAVSNKRIYIGVGKEGEVMEKDAKSLYDKLKIAVGDSERLFFNFFEKQSHGDVLHLAVYDSFEKLFREAEKK